MSKLENKLEISVNKGKVGFNYTNEKGESNYYSQFGYLKGKAKWAKILEPDQFGNYAVDVYPEQEDLDDIKSIIDELTAEAKELVEGVGKVVKGVADNCKVDDEVKEYIQFKRKEVKANGDANTPPKVINSGGNHEPSWDKLVGNGSLVKVGYTLSPYYMANTKMVGVSVKFYAIQVINLVEYSGGSGDSGFGDESDSQAPFDEGNGEDF